MASYLNKLKRVIEIFRFISTEIKDHTLYKTKPLNPHQLRANKAIHILSEIKRCLNSHPIASINATIADRYAQGTITRINAYLYAHDHATLLEL